VRRRACGSSTAHHTYASGCAESRTGSQSEVARGETAAVTLPQAAVVKAVEDERKLHLPIRESELSPGPQNRAEGE
jgi:hypothetical protein